MSSKLFERIFTAITNWALWKVTLKKKKRMPSKELEKKSSKHLETGTTLVLQHSVWPDDHRVHSSSVISRQRLRKNPKSTAADFNKKTCSKNAAFPPKVLLDPDQRILKSYDLVHAIPWCFGLFSKLKDKDHKKKGNIKLLPKFQFGKTVICMVTAVLKNCFNRRSNNPYLPTAALCILGTCS